MITLLKIMFIFLQEHAGTVNIKEKTWICAGATIINNITIAKNNIIGAGFVVIKDINEENGTHVGVPRRRV